MQPGPSVHWGLSLLLGPLLGSLNLNQGVSKTSSARRRRYIEEAELFNIEVREESRPLKFSHIQQFNLSFPPPGFAGCGLFCSSLPRPRAYSEISPDLHEHSKSINRTTPKIRTDKEKSCDSNNQCVFQTCIKGRNKYHPTTSLSSSKH